MSSSLILLPTDQLRKFVEQILPAACCLQMERLEFTSEILTLLVQCKQPQGVCPVCRAETLAVHSRYERVLQDFPWSSSRVQLRLRVRRFFCKNPSCPRRIFTERLPGLADPSARRTKRLEKVLLTIVQALGGEAGARHCRLHATPVGAATLLSLLRRAGRVSSYTPRVLGVDDWGWRRKQAGTILVDLEQHCPVELLEGSDEQTFAARLRSHPGGEVICRDRGVSYLKGAREGAPQAKQILDRWHLLKNLSEVLQKALAQRITMLRQAAEEANAKPSSDIPVPETLPPAQTRKPRKPPRRSPATPSPQRSWQLQTFQQVHQLLQEGCSQKEGAHLLHIHPHTVRKYRRLDHFVDRRHSPAPSKVEPYRAYLQYRWEQGYTMIRTLWQELRALGFTGSYRSVWKCTRFWPPPTGTAASGASVPGCPPPNIIQSPRTPRQAAWILMSDPEHLSEHDAVYRESLCQVAPSLGEASTLAQTFRSMVRQHSSEKLDTWLAQASTSPLLPLRRFALGLQQEGDAARAALEEPWSTAQVEGHITRLKLIKRQGYGRAKLDLLRLRVLHPT